MVLTWLRLLHPDLPQLVKQRYGTELRSRTLASIKPEISQALESLLEEVLVKQDAKVLRSGSSANPPSYPRWRQTAPRESQSQAVKRPNKVCPICKQAGRRNYNHFLSTCCYLPESDRQFISKARVVLAIEDEMSNSQYDEDVHDPVSEDIDTADQLHATTMRRVQVKQSPFLTAFHNHHALKITLDSGAETNMIRETVALAVGAQIKPSSQLAFQADGLSPLTVKGETHLVLERDNHTFKLDALVVECIDVDILAGVPFMHTNDISVRPAKHQVILGDGSVYQYSANTIPKSSNSIRRMQATVLRSPTSMTTVWPGDFVEIDIPDTLPDDCTFALEPRCDSPCTQHVKDSHVWPNPDFVNSVGGKIRLVNNTGDVKKLKRGEHFCQVLPVVEPGKELHENMTSLTHQCIQPVSKKKPTLHSTGIQLDPDNVLPLDIKSQFETLHNEFDHIFSPEFKGYNGASGSFQGVVNMGPVEPPQRKGRVPQYNRHNLLELQEKCDDLEKAGILAIPEEIGVVVEYLNPSFLVKKPSGGKRFVTAFAEVGRYSKPQPSLMPDVESTLRIIGSWKYIIATDLTMAFYQIPLSKGSMKYCGVATPFKGVRVYTRCAMGMPGSETALEELMCRVVGDLIQEGCVAKIADDLYCGGSTYSELLQNWRHLLEAMNKNGLHLAARKTVIAPKSTTVLGWVWTQGRLQASPHRISTLSTCSLPVTVKNMRSFIGAYKILSRTIANCAMYLAPLEDAIAGLQSSDKITWSEELRMAFTDSQNALAGNKSIVIPGSGDQLWIVTDGSVKRHGLGATLYVTRHNKLLLAGFFSAKLRKRQVTWIPCEIEALCISSAIKHFSPYIIQSTKQACVLTDSKPCVQAFEKLCKGDFSSSVRVSTFLTAVSRYQVSVRHLSGSANLPSDFASRNAPECDTPNCQICSFVAMFEESVVHYTSVQDIIEGSVKLPYTSRAAWRASQAECSDLRRVHSHLKQGTRPSKNATNIKDVKRYLNVASIAGDGLLVARKEVAFAADKERIIVPRQVLDGLLTAIHIKLAHPTTHQLKSVVHRYFFALDLDKAIGKVAASCHHCASLQKVPHTLIKQSTSDPPEGVGIAFAADVIKRERQLIFVLRESVTSYTSACLIDNEQSKSLREALIRLCIELRPLDGPVAVVRVDPAKGFEALVNDELLHSNRICIEIGRVKNLNKNPVGERAVQEVEEEILRQDASGGPVSSLMLSLAVATLNSRIRSRGLSAREMWFQRDQFTNEQIPITDHKVIMEQHGQRIKNHPYSEKSKAPLGKVISTPVEVGDLVYVYTDRNKSRGRDRYLVVSTEGEWCNIRKFVGHQLRSSSYRIKRSECYKVRSDSNLTCNSSIQSHVSDYESDDEVDDAETRAGSNYEPPPDIPPQLIQPPETETEPLPDPGSSNSLEVSSLPSDDSSDESVEEPVMVEPRRSTRQRSRPKRFNDYIL